jgi:hydroxymethylpyrimidine pyrophosphatase-like HAD family hydrolase
VAENGATLFDPRSACEEVLAEEPPARFVRLLQQKGVTPLELGRVIVATDESRSKAVLNAIHDLGLELHMIFNKGSLMILPSGVNKATGLKVALNRLGLSIHSVAGIGDAENDHAFLAACEFAAAVANALPTLKERVHLVTQGECGAGVTELMHQIAENDLRRHAAWLGQPINVGRDERGHDVNLLPAAVNLIAGTSGAGKSKVTTAFLEGLASSKYQFSVLDAEGDYENLEQAVVLGDSLHVPTPSDLLKALEHPSRNVVANMLGVELGQRPAVFRTMLSELQSLRNRLGRPHCIVVDEAHHFLSPPGATANGLSGVNELPGVTLVTVRPDGLPANILTTVHTLIVAGPDSADSIETFSKTAGVTPPYLSETRLDRGQMVAWKVGDRRAIPFVPLPLPA